MAAQTNADEALRLYDSAMVDKFESEQRLEQAKLNLEVHLFDFLILVFDCIVTCCIFI